MKEHLTNAKTLNLHNNQLVIATENRMSVRDQITGVSLKSMEVRSLMVPISSLISKEFATF